MTESAGALAVRENRALTADMAGALTGPQLKFISNTEFVPAGLRGNMPAIAACVATGRALGLADMTALRSIHIIDGKATFSAELMVQLARKAGHSITGDVSAEKATVTGKRADNGDTMTVTWTIQQAAKIKRKGKALTDGDNWKNYPESMLWARAVSQLCRMLFADCFAGASYTPEELGAGDVTADELLDEPKPQPEGESEGEIVVPEHEVEEALAGQLTPEPDPPAEQTPEQKDRLLELFSGLAEARPDTDWGGTLTAKIKKDYGADKYGDLTGPQMASLLAWLESELG